MSSTSLDMDNLLSEMGFTNEITQLTALERAVSIGVILAVCVIIFFVCKKLLFPFIKHLTHKTETTWDDHLLNDKVLNLGSYLLAALIANMFIPNVFSDRPFTKDVIDRTLSIVIIFICVRLICAFISSFHVITSETESLRQRPLKGLYQMLKVIVICIGIILTFSVLLDEEPGLILTGLGASAAILMLVFKDSIMGLVAGIQINAYDMLRPGDWIVMDKHNINGEVTEVSLNIIKIRNWDNSILTLPTHLITSESFQSWRNMRETNARRITITVQIDVNSITTLSPQQQEELQLRVPDCPPHVSTATNLHYYRYYMEAFLNKHPRVVGERTLMVRILPAVNTGIPVEIYCFTDETVWVPYEHIRSEIAEHAYTVLPDFGLRAFQSPSGYDFEHLKN